MHSLSELSRRPGSPVERADRLDRADRTQPFILVSLVLVVAFIDQISKAWAWRHLIRVHVNSGGDLLVGRNVSELFRDRTTGAACDVVNVVILILAAAWLLHRKRPRLMLCGAALALAGWASNLGDRLGLHFWTAPGSMRGVVDFLPWDGRYWNVADTAIIIGSTLFATSLVLGGLRMLIRPTSRQVWTHWELHRRPLAGKWGLPGVGIAVAAAAVLAAIGAIAYSGVSTPAVLAAGGGS